MRRRSNCLRVFRVNVTAHRVARWDIPAANVRVVAADADHAREIAVNSLHRQAAVPPWKPCIRESLQYATAGETRSPHR